MRRTRYWPAVLAAASISLLVGCGVRGPGPARVIREADYTGAIRVACVGNSITYGEKIPNREKQSYPAQLGRLLGEKWEVRNFGVTGATLLRKGNTPYWRENAFHLAQRFQPLSLIHI